MIMTRKRVVMMPVMLYSIIMATAVVGEGPSASGACVGVVLVVFGTKDKFRVMIEGRPVAFRLPSNVFASVAFVMVYTQG